MNIRTFFCAAFWFISSVHAAAESPDIAGHYFLQGAMEMGSQLLLRKDGTFAGQIVYGSTEGYAKGTWQVQGDTLSLLVDAPKLTNSPEKILFGLNNERDLNEIKTEVFYRPDMAQEFELAKSNYILTMGYEGRPAQPKLKPVDVYLEFSQGPPAQLLWRDDEQLTLSQPFDKHRTLKKIGVRMSLNSGPIQWFNVSSTSRMFDIGWKKTLGELSFEQPGESSLAEGQHYLRHASEDLEKIKHNYLIWLYYSETITPPVIKPVDVYWHFQDGSTQQQIWADSKQSLLVQPFDAKRTLQKIGFRTQGSTEPIQWIDYISPNKRWFSINWKEDDHGQSVDISELFRDMALEIKPNCLLLDLGDNKACYRK